MIRALAVATMVIATSATAHEAPKGWMYPQGCCGGMDCREEHTVRETANGYRVQTGETIKYGDKRLRDSPDGEFHRCARLADFVKGDTLCLFVPPRGM